MNNITISLVLNYISTCVFAFSGTKVALHSGDSLLVAFLAGILTANGGGTMRDLMNMRVPFWIKQPGYIIVSIIFSLISLFYDHTMLTKIPMYGL
jgi:uncharacterized membrane protein YeiH